MKQILHRKAELIVAVLLLFTAAFAQEMEVDGDLKVQGDIIFSDETAMSSASSGIPAGILAPFAGSTAPDGWLLCDGSAVSRTTYSSLFAVIAATYGAGDGSTTFTLPDLRGRMALGLDNMGGTSADRVTNVQADAMGGADGEETHQLTVDEMPSHNHSYIQSAGSAAAGGSNISRGGTNPYGPVYSSSSGGNQSHNNMPPYMALNYLIKY
jgi:microcystin-dependent protein